MRASIFFLVVTSPPPKKSPEAGTTFYGTWALLESFATARTQKTVAPDTGITPETGGTRVRRHLSPFPKMRERKPCGMARIFSGRLARIVSPVTPAGCRPEFP
jgi:hypothetical protein